MKIIGSDKGIHSPEFHKKKVWERRLKRAAAFVIAVVVIGVPIYLARTEKFLIASVEVSGNDVTKSEDLQKIIADNLSGNYLWIFPKSNALLYPKDAIQKELLDQEPRLSSVVITKPTAKSMKVVVTERSAVAEYCRDISDPAAPDDCYFIDDTGYIFAPAPAFSGNVYFTYATAEPFGNPIGESVLDRSVFSASRDFVKSLGDMGIYPRVFLVKLDEYHVLLSNGAEILWNKSANLDDVRASLEAFFSDKSVKSDRSFLSRVLYIDLRFGNKIFYKFREE